MFTSTGVGVWIATWSTHYFTVIQDSSWVKSFVDDSFSRRGTVSMRVTFVLRSAEVHPLFRDLCICQLHHGLCSMPILPFFCATLRIVWLPPHVLRLWSSKATEVNSISFWFCSYLLWCGNVNQKIPNYIWVSFFCISRPTNQHALQINQRSMSALHSLPALPSFSFSSYLLWRGNANQNK